MNYPSPHLTPGKRKTLAVAVSTVVASAYGAQQVGPIPANSTLIFEVELLKVTPPGSSTSQ